MKKASATIEEVAKSGAATAISVYAYNSRVVPIYGYKSQLAPLPPNFTACEIVGLQRLLHVVTNAFTRNMFFVLDSAGGPKITSIRAMARAALMRTAAHTVWQWADWVRQLNISADRHLAILNVARTQLNDSHWDTQAFCLNLAQAFEGDLSFQEPAARRMWNGIGLKCVNCLKALAGGIATPGLQVFKGCQAKLYRIINNDLHNGKAMEAFLCRKISASALVAGAGHRHKSHDFSQFTLQYNDCCLLLRKM